MGHRYVRRARGAFISFDDDGRISATAEDIILPDDERPQQTGLFDANGTPLYRVRERIKFGFVP